MVGGSGGKGIGASIPRFEDHRLLTGAGEYSDDYNRPGQVYAAFARAPHAHARLGFVDTEAALEMSGVIAVLTGADYKSDGLNAMLAQGNPKDVELFNRDSSPIHYPRIELLVTDKIRRVGEAVAMVIAETPDQARDAAEEVVTEYGLLPSVVDQVDA